MTRTGNHVLLTKFNSLLKSNLRFHQNICRKARLQVCLSNLNVCLSLWIWTSLQFKSVGLQTLFWFSIMFPDILLSSLNFKSFGPKFHNLLGLFFETRFLLCLISLGLYLLQRLTSNLARFFGRTRSAIEIIKVRNYARKSENTLKTIIWEWKNTLWSLVRLAALHPSPSTAFETSLN